MDQRCWAYGLSRVELHTESRPGRLSGEVVAVERYGDRGDALVAIDGISGRMVVRSGAMDLTKAIASSYTVPLEHVHVFRYRRNVGLELDRSRWMRTESASRSFQICVFD